jgi:hypothetical protein
MKTPRGLNPADQHRKAIGEHANKVHDKTIKEAKKKLAERGIQVNLTDEQIGNAYANFEMLGNIYNKANEGSQQFTFPSGSAPRIPKAGLFALVLLMMIGTVRGDQQVQEETDGIILGLFNSIAGKLAGGQSSEQVITIETQLQLNKLTPNQYFEQYLPIPNKQEVNLSPTPTATPLSPTPSETITASPSPSSSPVPFVIESDGFEYKIVETSPGGLDTDQSGSGISLHKVNPISGQVIEKIQVNEVTLGNQAATSAILHKGSGADFLVIGYGSANLDVDGTAAVAKVFKLNPDGSPSPIKLSFRNSEGVVKEYTEIPLNTLFGRNAVGDVDEIGNQGNVDSSTSVDRIIFNWDTVAQGSGVIKTAELVLDGNTLFPASQFTPSPTQSPSAPPSVSTTSSTSKSPTETASRSGSASASETSSRTSSISISVSPTPSQSISLSSTPSVSPLPEQRPVSSGITVFNEGGDVKIRKNGNTLMIHPASTVGQQLLSNALNIGDNLAAVTFVSDGKMFMSVVDLSGPTLELVDGATDILIGNIINPYSQITLKEYGQFEVKIDGQDPISYQIQNRNVFVASKSSSQTPSTTPSPSPSPSASLFPQFVAMTFGGETVNITYSENQSLVAIKKSGDVFMESINIAPAEVRLDSAKIVADNKTFLVVYKQDTNEYNVTLGFKAEGRDFGGLDPVHFNVSGGMFDVLEVKELFGTDVQKMAIENLIINPETQNPQFNLTATNHNGAIISKSFEIQNGTKIVLAEDRVHGEDESGKGDESFFSDFLENPMKIGVAAGVLGLIAAFACCAKTKCCTEALCKPQSLGGSSVSPVGRRGGRDDGAYL